MRQNSLPLMEVNLERNNKWIPHWYIRPPFFSSMQRRTLLQLAGASASLTLLSGCQFVSAVGPGCPRDQRTSIYFSWARHVEEYREHILPFSYSELSENFPEIIEEIASDGEYERCSPLPDEAKTFVSSVKKRITRQFEEYDEEQSEGMKYQLSSAYVERKETIETIYLYHDGELISGNTALNSTTGENEPTTTDANT